MVLLGTARPEGTARHVTTPPGLCEKTLHAPTTDTKKGGRRSEQLNTRNPKQHEVGDGIGDQTTGG